MPNFGGTGGGEVCRNFEISGVKRPLRGPWEHDVLLVICAIISFPRLLYGLILVYFLRKSL
ncbi:hypothetical protein [Bartonella sp. CB178]|uniref:hypothetical protein n=1 Tax=Bartonella sp. CB178 TaxID=3112255 RepID=UPI00300DCFAC